MDPIVSAYRVSAKLLINNNSNNNNQTFYFQLSWGTIEMKPREPKKKGQNKSEKEVGKTKGDKKPNQKRRKGNKTLSQKRKKGWEKKLDKKAIKEETEYQGFVT
jgi:hypothetical protein